MTAFNIVLYCYEDNLNDNLSHLGPIKMIVYNCNLIVKYMQYILYRLYIIFLYHSRN